MKRITDKQKRRLMRKAKQLAAADIARRTGKDPTTREAHLKAIVGPSGIAFQARTGYFAPRSGPVYTMSDLDVAEALDQPGHMVQVCAKLGFTMLSQLLRYPNPAAGTQALTDLAERAAKLMKLDVEALRAELAAERAEEAKAEAEKAAADAAAEPADGAFANSATVEVEPTVEP
jgi:hypothetical protein